MTYSQAEIDLANFHVAQGERHVMQQERLISRLLSRGLPTSAAEELLAMFESALQQHREHRDRMIEASRP